MQHAVAQAMDRFLTTYTASRRALLESDPEFASWLRTEYTPIAGAWQY